MESDLTEKINAYLERAKKNRGEEKNKLETHSLEEEGYWIIIKADSRDSDKHPLEKVFYGKFIDMLAYAVQQNFFYHDFVLPQVYDPGDFRSGIVKKINITILGKP